MPISIAEVSRAPGKSMRAEVNTEALHLDEHGMFGDREIMWIESAQHTNQNYHPGDVAVSGQFLSQREDPVLTSIIPTLSDEGCSLRCEEDDQDIFIPRRKSHETQWQVSVWGWSGWATDQGMQAADWGTYTIGRPVRLVAVNHNKPRYVEDNPGLGRVGFSDGYPLLVTSQASVDELNRHLESVGKPTVPTDRFRGNIHLDGLEPFQEDFIESITVSYSGLSLALKRIKACGRCPIPDTDQISGNRKQHVRSALGKLGRNGMHVDTARYGEDKKIFFGQNFVIEMPKEMGPGDTFPISRDSDIVVVFSDNTNWVRT